MIRINIYEARTHLSRYLARLRKGGRILLCRRNVPIAQILPLEEPLTKERPVGLARGAFTVPEAFFAPLPTDLASDFEGGAR